MGSVEGGGPGLGSRIRCVVLFPKVADGLQKARRTVTEVFTEGSA